jgi:hypothetical protein
MKKYIQIIFLLLFISSCRTDTKKELPKKEKTVSKYELADIELMDQKEKIILLSAIKEVPYDTLYHILKDYYAASDNIIFLSDKDVINCNKTINSISEKYQIPKSKVASLIFCFKYEMQTKQDIKDEIDQETQYQQDENIDDSGY